MITDEQSRINELYRVYMRGFKNGVSNTARLVAPDYEDKELYYNYELGYIDGRQAAHVAAINAAKRLNYNSATSILR